MTVTTASFRTKFVELADIVRYPNWMVDYYTGLSYKLINNPARWGELEDDGRFLFIAHHLVLERKALDAITAGGIPGSISGVVTSRSVDKVSVGYDISSVTEEGGGHWNLTIYGLRLYSLMKMMGAGPLQTGADSLVYDPLSSANAWPGPTTGPLNT